MAEPKFVDLLTQTAAQAQARISEINSELPTLSSEIDDIRNNQIPGIEEVNRHRAGALRSLEYQRSEAIALGNDTAEFDSKIAQIKADSQTAEQELSSLNESLNQKEETVAALNQELSNIQQQEKKRELYTLYDQYNTRAASLASTVKAIHQKRKDMGCRDADFSEAGETVWPGTLWGDSRGGALVSIPKILIEGRRETGPSHAGAVEKNGRWYKEGVAADGTRYSQEVGVSTRDRSPNDRYFFRYGTVES